MIRNERGVTLIELLATLTILSFAGTLIWSVFFQGYQFSQKSITKNMLQQEANILITNLTKIHQTSRHYEILNTPCELTVEITNSDASKEMVVYNSPNMCFESSHYGSIDPYLFDIEVTLTVKDLNNSSNTVAVDTLLYRLKDGGK